MDLGKIRAGLKEVIDKINGLHAEDLSDRPEPPCAVVYPNPPFNMDETFDGAVNPSFCVLILVPYVDTKDAQERLDEYLSTEGDRSVKLAIENDTTLEQIGTTASVTKLTSYGVTEMGDGVRYLSAEFEVELWAA